MTGENQQGRADEARNEPVEKRAARAPQNLRRQPKSRRRRWEPVSRKNDSAAVCEQKRRRPEPRASAEAKAATRGEASSDMNNGRDSGTNRLRPLHRDQRAARKLLRCDGGEVPIEVLRRGTARLEWSWPTDWLGGDQSILR